MRNYVASNTLWVRVQRHLLILVKPVLAAALAAAIWRLAFHPGGVHLKSADPLTLMVIPLGAFIYAIFGGIALTSVFDQYKAISRAVVRQDVDDFLLYRDEQLPVTMHLLIGASSLVLILFVMLFDYEGDTTTGTVVVFAITFLLALVWRVATELDNFQRSIWFRAKIPADWYTIDIEQHFKRAEVPPTPDEVAPSGNGASLLRHPMPARPVKDAEAGRFWRPAPCPLPPT